MKIFSIIVMLCGLMYAVNSKNIYDKASEQAFYEQAAVKYYSYPDGMQKSNLIDQEIHRLSKEKDSDFKRDIFTSILLIAFGLYRFLYSHKKGAVDDKFKINRGANENSPNTSFKEMYVICPECKEVIKSAASRCKYCGCKLIANRSPG